MQGDWDNWRNEWLTTSYRKGQYAIDFSEGREFDYSDDTPEPLPPHGVLEIDYISTDTNHRLAAEKPMHAVRQHSSCPRSFRPCGGCLFHHC